MINFLYGPPCSGLGLMESVLSRSKKVTTKSLPNGIGGDFVFESEFKYIVYSYTLLIRKYLDSTIVIIRCPFSSFLGLIEAHSKRLDRDLLDEEVDFHASVFNKKLIYINSLINDGVKYFAMRNNDKLLYRMNDLSEMICGDRLVIEEDLRMFYESLITYRYTSMDCFSKQNKKEIQKMGTIYGKYGIELEI